MMSHILLYNSEGSLHLAKAKENSTAILSGIKCYEYIYS